jgi:CheY-like chemotaxis protein
MARGKYGTSSQGLKVTRFERDENPLTLHCSSVTLPKQSFKMKSRQLQLRDPAVILMVDENVHGLVARKTVLGQNGFAVITATNAEMGLQFFAQQHIDLVVTEYRMQDMDGPTFIARLRELNPTLPIILLSGLVEMLGLDERSTGADAVLAKSASEATSLVRTVTRLLARRTLRKPVRRELGVPAAVVTNVG